MKELVKQQHVLKKKILTAQQKKLSNFSLGSHGEKLACEYLGKNNFQVLAQNVRVNNNEIDIVAIDKATNELAFVEVKTRRNSDFGTPETAVTKKKLQSMHLVAKQYIKSSHCNLDYRFDIIAISYLGNNYTQTATVKPQIEHFENITWP